MRDLTDGPVGKHIVHLASFIAMSAAFQTLYYLADLYFVGRLGKEAIAGVGLAGNLVFIVLALTQALGVGTTALISQALGRKDTGQGELVFNQSLVLSEIVGLAFAVTAFVFRAGYCRSLAADPRTAALGAEYLGWFIPALFLQFALVSMAAALRGMGDVQVPTLIQIGTVIVNVALAPVLMFGWLTGHPFGVSGAAMASLTAVGVGCLAFVAYFSRRGSPLGFRRDELAPRPALWGEVLKIGLPAGGEFALMSVYMILVYFILRPFGAATQAGFGIGVRVVQALFLPIVAVAFATAPVVGQNFGARRGDRVREAFRQAAFMSVGVMVLWTALCHWVPETLIRGFSSDPTVIAAGAEYLRIISWNFITAGLVFVTSSVFQGIGNTLPALASSSLRLLLFALPAWAISRQPWFEIPQLWYLSVVSVAIQLCFNLWLLRRELDLRLPAEAPAGALPEGA
jgi:putative MATE family efflux protein